MIVDGLEQFVTINSSSNVVVSVLKSISWYSYKRYFMLVTEIIPTQVIGREISVSCSANGSKASIQLRSQVNWGTSFDHSINPFPHDSITPLLHYSITPILQNSFSQFLPQPHSTLCFAQHFIQGRNPFVNFCHATHPQRFHSFLNQLFFKL